MHWLSYTLGAGSALALSIEDIKSQTLPLSGVTVFALATVLHLYTYPSSEGLVAAAFLLVLLTGCCFFFRRFKKISALGGGDAILMPLCGLWLSLEEVPVFLISAGACSLLAGILWRLKWGMGTFPMAPAIFAGLGVTFITRCL